MIQLCYFVIYLFSGLIVSQFYLNKMFVPHFYPRTLVALVAMTS